MASKRISIVSDVRFDAEGFFLSAVDQARYQRMMDSLVHQRRSIALLSSSGGLVEHYGQRLLRSLRSRPDVVLETYTPGSPEALMSRLNQLLEPLSVDQARGSNEAVGPLRVFALHELEDLDPDEAALLARMVQDLPGARIALLILGYRRRRLPGVLEESFRRGLRSWSIPVPSEEALEAFEADADAQGLGDEVASLVAQLRRERVAEAIVPPEANEVLLEAPVSEPLAERPSASLRSRPPALVRWPFLLAAGLTVLALSWWYGVGQKALTVPASASSVSGELSTR
jgi:hypothetical protein